MCYTTRTMSTFVHLHNHTEYSLLDGAARISKLVKTAKEHGAPAVAITDHGNMYGTYKFYKECKKQGIKAIIGCEIYVVGDLTSRIPSEHRAHLILLAKDNEGYTNLCKINSKAWTDGFYYKPRVDYSFLSEHCKGLICLSGCLAGHIPQLLMQGMYDEAKKYAVNLKNIFGDNFYIELQDHNMPEQKEVNPKLIQIAKELGIELVATNDVHYIFADDAEMQDALMCVEMRKTVDDPERMRFSSDQFYMKTFDEMNKLFGTTAPSALSNTLAIADKCNCHPFEKANLIPEFKKEGVTDNAVYLRQLVEEGLKKKYGKITSEIQERYETEFKVIHKQGFIDYFLIVADFMKFANDKGIAVGPGRGSGAGSIIAYALNITLLDPLRYGLLFERFLHGERVSSPDFDLDFCCNRRGEVIDYVIEKYGHNKVCQIVTFGTLAAKAAIKDIARVFKMPYAEVDTITKPMVFNQQVRPPVLPYVFDIKKIKDPRTDAAFETWDEKKQEQAVDDFKKEQSKLAELRKPELINLYRNNPEIKKIVDMALKVEGFPRNCSTHAAGVIICNKVVGDVTPLQRNGTDITSQFDMKEIEELGMLKMDFLGLITLTDIQGALNDIEAQLGIKVDFYGMEYNDQEVYKMISEGDTDAVFQLESGGFKSFMKQLKPDCIEDIIAGVALFRPGPMDMIPDYCKNKHNPKLTKYEHPLLEPILKETYGQIVYQEQVMDIFKSLGGYSLGQADMVRRAMGKKDIKEMDKQRDIFLNGNKKTNIPGAIANGVKKEIATSIFNKMQKFAGYAFNKSHAACYAFIAYQTAYLKHYYYPYYMASVLNNRVHKWDDMTHYINSMSTKGMRILPPSINKSGAYFTVEKTHSREESIRFGLAALKNVGVAVIENILQERKNNGNFKSFQDFCNRVELAALNKRCLDSLILSGAFDELGAARSQLMTVYPGIVKLLGTEKKAVDSGQISMFGEILKNDKAAEIKLPDIREYDQPTKLKFEKEVVGMYLSGHPLQQYSHLLTNFNFNTSYIKHSKEEDGNDDSHTDPNTERLELNDDGEETDTPTFGNNSSVSMGAIIVEVKRVLTKASKKEMAIVRMEDLFGSCDVMIFPGQFEKCRHLLNKDAVVNISGKLSLRDGEEAIILADRIELLGAATEKTEDINTPVQSAEKTLYIKYNTADTDLHNEVMAVLGSYNGTIAVVVKCTASNQALSPRVKIRDCRAVIYELASLLGEENVVLK